MTEPSRQMTLGPVGLWRMGPPAPCATPSRGDDAFDPERSEAENPEGMLERADPKG
jgi:hypothetical protein